MAKREKTQQHDIADLRGAETVCLSLTDLADKFEYSDADRFRRMVLERGRIPFRRVSRNRWQVRKDDLPAGF